MQHRKVVIGTPTMDGKVEAEYAVSLAETMRICVQRGIEIYPLCICYESIIQNIRNDLLGAMLKYDCTDIIFIDADQGWDPEWVPKLLSYPVDVVGGTVRKKTDERELYNVKHGSVHIETDPKTGLWMVDSLGTGFLRMTRKAVEALWNSSVEYRVWNKEPSRWVFDIRPIAGQLVGEDVMVSLKLKDLGFQTYLDPDMVCIHIGVKKYIGNFKNWLAVKQTEQAQLEKAG